VYTLNGSVAFDTLTIFAADLSNPLLNRHTYGLAYGYDLAGRRTSLTPPSGLSVLSPVSYEYHPETGDLQRVNVVNGGSFRHAYTNGAPLDSLIQADGTVERHYYDADGREYRRSEFSVSRNATLHDETAILDGRGRRKSVDGMTYGGPGLNESYAY